MSASFCWRNAADESLNSGFGCNQLHRQHHCGIAALRWNTRCISWRRTGARHHGWCRLPAAVQSGQGAAGGGGFHSDSFDKATGGGASQRTEQEARCASSQRAAPHKASSHLMEKTGAVLTPSSQLCERLRSHLGGDHGTLLSSGLEHNGATVIG